ncbi:unnamed protein product, partial [Ascophyllum nodosum]
GEYLVRHLSFRIFGLLQAPWTVGALRSTGSRWERAMRLIIVRRRSRRRRPRQDLAFQLPVAKQFYSMPPRLVLVLMVLLVVSPTEAWWTPGPGVTWQWQLDGDLDLDVDVDMYNIDLFDVSEAEIEELRERGVVVICSFSAGTYEEDRADTGDFNVSWLGNEVPKTDGDLWVDVTHDGVMSIMEGRLNLAVNKSCDGVEPSNVQVYLEEDSGFNISANDQIVYNSWLADEAHARNLSVGLRNDWPQVEELEPSFDWALSEDCLFRGECDGYQANFVAAEKAVFDAEYFQFDLSFCGNVTALGLGVIIKDLSLDSRRCSCQKPSTHIGCDSLLITSTSESSGKSSPWVIGTAVGASIAIILTVGLISAWRRRKFGASGGGSGEGPADGSGYRQTARNGVARR